MRKKTLALVEIKLLAETGTNSWPRVKCFATRHLYWTEIDLVRFKVECGPFVLCVG